MKSRNVLKMFKIHHPKTVIGGLYVKRKGGGRGLLQIEATYQAKIINVAEYLKTKYTEDQFLSVVKSYESNQPNMKSTIKVETEVAEELSQSNVNSDTKKESVQHTTAKL
jgi:hypothetical protein